jgi:hypothetical protein
MQTGRRGDRKLARRRQGWLCQRERGTPALGLRGAGFIGRNCHRSPSRCPKRSLSLTDSQLSRSIMSRLVLACTRWARSGSLVGYVLPA